jgi:DNA adenine methylase
MFIFLNKTSFNGLYRENLKGEYNTPFSKNSHPLICDTGNLYRAHCALQRVTLLNYDFEVLNSYVDETTLLYIDPPYAPISKTSNFTRYNGKGFTNTDQLRLAQWCQFLNEIGAKLIISNSAPNDGSVHRLYDGFRVETVSAKRSISADPTKRSNVNELIITNLTP